METRVVAGNVAQIRPDAVMVNLCEGVERPDRAAVDKVLNGGAIAAAPFLGEFAGDTPWLHLDMAGPRHPLRRAETS